MLAAVIRLRPLMLLTVFAALIVFDLTTASRALLRWYCGPTYARSGYTAACRVELGSMTRDLREMLRARNRPSMRPYNGPARRPRVFVG